MAERRKKLEKTEETPSQNIMQRFQCSRCGCIYSRQRGHFPASHSPMYRGTGYLPVCSKCVDELYNYYNIRLGDGRAAMRRVCMKFDLYWNDAIYDMALKATGANSRVRNYIGRSNIIRYVDKTFDDTLDEEAAAASAKRAVCEQAEVDDDEEAQVTQQEPVMISQETIDFWGAGYSPDFYAELDRRYKGWTENLKTVQPNEKSLYRQICLLETIIGRDGAQGKSIDKNVNVLNTLLGSMNLKPAQKKSEAEIELENMPLGVGIQKWENLRPLPTTPDELKDQSGIVKNITTWFLGHACKMVGLKNSYCKMYEDAIQKYRVEYPEFSDEDDDTFLTDIFSGSIGGDADGSG